MYVLILLSGLLFIIYCYGWFLMKQNLVLSGNARPDFPYARYTEDELNKMYPQYANEKVPTRMSPEQTYAKFIEALKKGDLEEASKQFVLGKQKEWLASLQKIKEKGMMESFIRDFDKNLIKDSLYETTAQFSIGIENAGNISGRRIGFLKDSQGDFKIESL